MSNSYRKHSDQNPKSIGGNNTRQRSNVPIPERKALAQYRVVQRDLVYVIGIPTEIAQESVLSKYEYFGQYGPIKKIVVNSNPLHNQNFKRPTVSAYVTFINISDALECIYSLEDFSYNGYNIKASLGTSKYCTNFLCNQPCTNHDCMYLHQIGNPDDSFTTDEIQEFTERFTSITRPSRPSDYNKYKFQDAKPTVFPPRRILTKTTDSTDSTQTQHSSPQQQYNNAEDGEYYSLGEEDQETIQNNEEEESRQTESLSNIFKYRPLTVPPLSADYTVGMSLEKQLNLGTSSVRSILEKLV